MKKWVGYVLLAICLVVAYQGWGNVKNTRDSEDAATNMVCHGMSDCIAKPGLVAFKADVINRRYQFETNQGPITVTCKRAYLFFGAWGCTPAAGTI